MARVFKISEGREGYKCDVSTLAFEQNKAAVCNVAPRDGMKPDAVLAPPTLNFT